MAEKKSGAAGQRGSGTAKRAATARRSSKASAPQERRLTLSSLAPAPGSTQSRKHANDDAEHDANKHHHDVEGLQSDREALKKIGDFFHLASPATVS